MEYRIRSFIAIELPEHIRSTILKMQKRLKPGMRGIKWVRPENIHLTLRFLGGITSTDIDKVKESLAGAVKGLPPFLLSAKGMGAFPGISRPRVLWIGLGGEVGRLMELYNNMESKLAANGFEREKRRFKGHLTIGRVKGRIDSVQLVESVKSAMDFESDTFSVDRIILFKSELKPDGPIYTRLYSAELST